MYITSIKRRARKLPQSSAARFTEKHVKIGTHCVHCKINFLLLWWVITVIIQFLIFWRVITFCIVMNLCLFEFYVGFINFLTEFRNFSLIKFSDNLNFLLIWIFGLCQVSGSFSIFRLVLNTLHLRFVSGVFFASSSNFRIHSIFCNNFSRLSLVTRRHETPGRGNIPCWSKMADRVMAFRYFLRELLCFEPP